jgi:FkbM family methyltransferase
MASRIVEAITWRTYYWKTCVGKGVLMRLPWIPGLFSKRRDWTNYCHAQMTLSGAPVTLAIRKLNGGTVQCRPGTSDPWVLWDVFRNGFHLPPESMAEPSCILDLGANVGYTAAHFAAVFPKARVVAVEMDGDNAGIARENVAPYAPRCELVHAAVWTSDGEITYGGHEQQGYRISQLDDKATGGTKTVATISISSLLDRRGIDVVDYLKMDIEGAEAHVLVENTGWMQRVNAMKLEVHPPATIEFCSKLLTDAGFECSPDSRHSHCVVAIRRPFIRR